MTNRDHAGVWFPPPLLFVIPLVVSAALQSRRAWPAAESGTMLATGAGLLATAAAIGVASVYSFRKAQTTILPAGRPTTAIVERGPYRFTRNPMYVAMTVAYIGLALLLGMVWALVWLPLIVAVVDRAVIRREERYLDGKFGQSYRDYCLRVRRWL